MRDSNAWIQTYTGRKFFPLEPRVEDINLLDIAHALSLKCRFSGHCTRFYSVAAHSVSVSRALTRASFTEKLWGLLHDAGEAYLPDVPSPLKGAFSGLKAAEDRILQCVADAFGLPWPIPESVKRADVAVLVMEQQNLMHPIPGGWPSLDGIEPTGTLMDCPNEVDLFMKDAAYLLSMVKYDPEFK